jgi:hypothetical protein
VTEVTRIPKREIFLKFETIRGIGSPLFNRQVSHSVKAMLTCRKLSGNNSMATRSTAAKSTTPKATISPTRRGRPPRKVYINVLVKATTRDGLARLKASGSLASQGEVIDELVEKVVSVKTRSGN